jgi:hypothetical protein
MSAAKETAAKILAVANEYGWEVTVRGSILTITKSGINSIDDFVHADMEYFSILGLLPSTSPGSIWGTTGDGVGALSAMTTRRFVVNKSGGSKRILKAIASLV